MISGFEGISHHYYVDNIWPQNVNKIILYNCLKFHKGLHGLSSFIFLVRSRTSRIRVVVLLTYRWNIAKLWLIVPPDGDDHSCFSFVPLGTPQLSFYMPQQVITGSLTSGSDCLCLLPGVLKGLKLYLFPHHSAHQTLVQRIHPQSGTKLPTRMHGWTELYLLVNQLAFILVHFYRLLYMSQCIFIKTSEILYSFYYQTDFLSLFLSLLMNSFCHCFRSWF